MTDTRVICGLAIPYDAPRCVGGAVEMFRLGAFANQLARSPMIELRWGSHAPGAPVLASTTSGNLALFEDGKGLWLRALVSNRWESGNRGRFIAMTARAAVDCCSIGGLDVRRQNRRNRVVEIVDASIDHVAIVAGAAYPTTAAWISDMDLSPAPMRIQARAREFEAAWRRHRVFTDLTNEIARERRASRAVAAPTRVAAGFRIA